MNKRLSIVFTLIFLTGERLYACTTCESRQPKVLRGFTHGAGPESSWDYLLIIISCLIVLVALVLSIKYLVKPNENNIDHIKNSILRPHESVEL